MSNSSINRTYLQPKRHEFESQPPFVVLKKDNIIKKKREREKPHCHG